MSDAQEDEVAEARLPQTGSRFQLRRIHSLTGVFPLGVFLFLHLWTNSHALNGQASFDAHMKDLREMPYTGIIEIGFVILPLLFHALYGVKLAFEGRPNIGKYPSSRNWMYGAQRVTGLFAFAFIVWHLSEYWVPRYRGLLDPTAFYPALCQNLSATRFGLPLAALAYVFGMAACVFHFANGLWGFCLTWGLTVTARSQRVSATVFGLVGILVFFLGANTAIYFATGSRIAIFGVPGQGSGTRVTRTCEDALAPPPPEGPWRLPLPGGATAKPESLPR